MFSVLTQRFGKWLAIAAMLGFGLAFAQSEPTLVQVYEAAQSGKMEQAQTMIQQVLVAHPNSAKAHFVQAELFARQGLNSRAADMLATAEKLAPGLPFAKPEAIQSLRAKISARSVQQASNNGGGGNSSANHINSASIPAAAASTFSWSLPLLLTGGVMLIGYFVFRRKDAAVEFHAQPAGQSFGSQAPAAGGPAPMANGLSGPQTFGMGGGAAPAPAYSQPPASGLGSNIAGGLATGLAVGAGMMAAQAIGKSLMGNNEGNHDTSSRLANNTTNSYEPIADNSMGGQNFGVNDTSSWDDGGSADVGGGDWDS